MREEGAFVSFLPSFLPLPLSSLSLVSFSFLYMLLNSEMWLESCVVHQSYRIGILGIFQHYKTFSLYLPKLITATEHVPLENHR